MVASRAPLGRAKAATANIRRIEVDGSDLIDDQERDPEQTRGSSASRPCRCASASLPTTPSRCQRGRARLAGRRRGPERDRQVHLPGAGGPSRTTFSFARRKSSWPRSRTSVFCTERWKLGSRSSNVFRAWKRACLPRRGKPCGRPMNSASATLPGRRYLRRHGLPRRVARKPRACAARRRADDLSTSSHTDSRDPDYRSRTAGFTPAERGRDRTAKREG